MTVPDTTDVLPPKTDHPAPPFTLAIDIGGTGLKASVLDAAGAMVADRVKIPTTYPLTPDKLVDDLVRLTQPLPKYDRISAGFPGMIREGHVLTAPHFVCKSGPGSDVEQSLVTKWNEFDLADALS
jgi:polyphosphate glucokinase